MVSFKTANCIYAAWMPALQRLNSSKACCTHIPGRSQLVVVYLVEINQINLINLP